VRYTRDEYTQFNPYGNGSFSILGEGEAVRKGMGAAWNLATTINPTFTNEFTMGISQNLIPNNPVVNNTYTLSKLGLSFTPLFPAAVLADEGPSVSFGGNYISNTPSLGSGAPNFADNTNFNFIDNLSKVFANHTLTGGFSIERDRKDQTSGSGNGSLNFSTNSNNTTDAGYTYADALIGNFNTYSQVTQQRTGKYRFTNGEWYIADTWKVSRKLTIDGGIRFYMMQPIYDAKGELGQFVGTLNNGIGYNPANAVRLYQHLINPATGKLMAWDPVTNTFANPVFYGNVVPGSGNPINGFYLAGTNGIPRGLAQFRGVQFGPAIGFAYALDLKTVIRAGGRVAFDRVQGNPWYYNLGIPPTTHVATLEYGNLNTLTATPGLYTPVNPGSNGAGMSQDGHIPTVYSYNFSIQRELPLQIVAEASYVGNLNRHLDELVDINMTPWGSEWLPQNQDPSYTGVNLLDGTHALPGNFYRPYPGVDRLNTATWGGTANYNSLQVTAKRRARNLTFQLAYTFSKAMGTADSIYNASAIPGEVRQANYGRLAYDHNQVLVVAYTYTFPRPIQGHNPFLNNFVTRTIFNDWQVSAITTLRSGSPYSLSYSVLNANLNQLITGNADFGPRATIVGNPHDVSGGANPLDEFNLASVAQTAKGSHGNDSGFNYMTNPWYWNTDMGVFKNVPLTKDNQKRYVQFRIEFYNIENHTNWGGVASTVQYSAVGPGGSTGTILNLPQYLVGAGATNGGRFGVGAEQSPGGGRTGVMSLKLYF
jgi:hypothetical protein